MGPYKLLWVALYMLLSGCSPTSFVVATDLPVSLGQPVLKSIPYDLLCRCKVKVTYQGKTRAADCMIWVGANQTRLEVSHSLLGLLMYAEVNNGHLVTLDGQTGRQRHSTDPQFEIPFLRLDPQVLKALLLGRRLEGSRDLLGLGRPERVVVHQEGQEVQVEYQYWFMQQGIEVPKVINASYKERQIRLVILHLELGHGVALGPT